MIFKSLGLVEFTLLHLIDIAMRTCTNVLDIIAMVLVSRFGGKRGTARVCFVAAALVTISSQASSAEPTGLGGRDGKYEELLKELRSLEWQTVSESDSSAVIDMAALRELQLASRGKVKSLQVDFDYQCLRKLKLASELVAEKHVGITADDFRLSSSFALAGDNRYVFYEETSEAKSETNPSYTYAFDGNECRTFEPRRALGQIHPEKVAGLESHAGRYTDMINWFCGSNAAEIENSSVFVPTALRMETLYKLQQRLEKVDGFECYVVSSGDDTFWLDAAHGGIMRRRVLFRKASVEDPGCLSNIFICKSFKDCGDGIWLPQDCYRLDYATQTEPLSVRGKLASINHVTTRNIQVNDVPETRFTIDFPSGTQVQDLVDNKVYVVPGGAELLDQVIADAMPIVGGEVQPTGILRSSGRSLIVWIINLVAVVVLLVIVVRRRLMQNG